MLRSAETVVQQGRPGSLHSDNNKGHCYLLGMNQSPRNLQEEAYGSCSELCVLLLDVSGSMQHHHTLTLSLIIIVSSCLRHLCPVPSCFLLLGRSVAFSVLQGHLYNNTYLNPPPYGFLWRLILSYKVAVAVLPSLHPACTSGFSCVDVVPLLAYLTDVYRRDYNIFTYFLQLIPTFVMSHSFSNIACTQWFPQDEEDPMFQIFLPS